MSLKPQPTGPVPELTAYVARAAFPDGNPYMSVRDTLGTFYDDECFAALFPDRGQPAETPWRLALITVLQYAGDSPIARPPRRSVAASTGNTPSAWS